MLDLDTSSESAVSLFGKNLFMKYRAGLHSFEEAANVCVNAIYDEFRQSDEQPAFALVRVYRLCRYEELLPDLQKLAIPEITYWIALMATVGIEHKKNEVIRTISARRFELALKAFAIPDNEIRAAWDIVGRCCGWANDPLQE